jgi:beta-galactosidase
MLKSLHLLFHLTTLLPAAEFKVDGNSFVLEGKPLQIRSGEIHYPRVPKAEWGNRIRMAKAMGLNTVSTYVFWNLHELKRGVFDFSGEKDVAEFVRTCAAEGMKVIVRPGPYVCAEWDSGGLPAWLLAEPGIKLRSTDPRYLEPAKAWMKRMGEMLQPLSVAQGGPVLMVQLENEFGNFGKDPEYLKELEKALRDGGYKGILFTDDGPMPRLLRDGGLPGMLKAVNFGRDAEGSFQVLKAASPDQPAFNAEFWVGWFDQWESPHHFGDSRQKVEDFRHIMNSGASFNLYMFHGGSTRGLWTGANWAKTYRPTTCCYDYGAPLDESGRPTHLYHSFRSLIQRAEGERKLTDVPVQAATGSIGTIPLMESRPLLGVLPKGEVFPEMKTMELLGQTTGMILYRSQISGPVEGTLELGGVKDRVHVHLDGKVVGVSGRSTQNGAVAVAVQEGNHSLDLLVENMGRINYGLHLLEERKGISGDLSLGDRKLGPFEHIRLDMQSPPMEGFVKIEEEAAAANPADSEEVKVGGGTAPAKATY